MNPQPKKSIKLKPAAWKKLVAECFERDRYQCETCKYIFPFEYLAPHHIIPKGRIRLDCAFNVATLCKSCHRALHDGNLDISVDDLIKLHGLDGLL